MCNALSLGQIKSSIRRKTFSLTIIFCTLAIASGYLYLYINESDLRRIWLTIFIITTLLILVQLGFFICSNRRKGKKIRAARKEIEIQCADEYSSFTRMAKEMGVELTCAFLKVRGLDNVGFDTSKQQLVLGTNLWNEWNLEQQNAIVAHEFAHAAKWHRIPNWHNVRIWLWCILAVFFVCMTTMGALAKEALWFQFLFGLLMGFALVTLVLTIVSHHNEYAADLIAAERTNTQVLIEALGKIPLPDVEYITHPSIDKRIARLRQIFSD